MADMEKANKAVEKLAAETRDSYWTVVDQVVSLQERNVKNFWGAFNDVSREITGQFEANRAMTQELVERAEKQRGAFQTVVEESVDAYMDFLFAPLAYYKQGLKLVENEVTNGGFPIRNYDELNVEQISQQIEGLSAAEIRQVRSYEKQHKNRDTLIEQFDRKLRAAAS